MIKDFNRVPLMMAENQGTKNPFKRLSIWLKNKMQPKPKEEIKGQANPSYNPGGQSDEGQINTTAFDGKTSTATNQLLTNFSRSKGPDNRAPTSNQNTIAETIENEKQAMDGEGNSAHKQTEQVSIIKIGTPTPPPPRTDLNKSGTPPPPPPMPDFNTKPQPGAWRINKPEQATTTTNEPSNQTAAKGATHEPKGMSMADMLKGDKKQVKQIETKTQDQIAASQKASMERAAELKSKRAASEQNINTNKKPEPISKSASEGDLKRNSEIETTLPSFKERQAAIQAQMSNKFNKPASKVEQDERNKTNTINNSQLGIK